MNPRVAIVHDYLIQMGGAEQVVAALHRMFPEAPIYTSAVDYARLTADFVSAELVTSWMQQLPGMGRHFKKYLPLYPMAFRSLGEVDADVAIISSSGFSKWIRVSDRTTTVCYCHTPPRFFWDAEAYLRNEVRNAPLRELAGLLTRLLRVSDYREAQRIDYYVANSNCVRERIKRTYGRDAVTIYPPVNVGDFAPTPAHEGYYLIASRLVAYKGIDVAIQAFARYGDGRQLLIAGDGPDRARLQSMAPPNVKFLGWVTRSELVRYMQNCYALIFPGEEDFGITPIEAHACGKPVLAFAGGGALETISPGVNGQWFACKTVESLGEALPLFEQNQWDCHRIHEGSLRYGEDRFARELKTYLESVL